MRDRIFITIIAIILLIVPITIFFREDKDISWVENRTLFKKTDIKVENLNDDINKWLQDQFIGGQTIKKMYNKGKNKAINISMKLLEKSNLMQLIPVSDNICRLANTDYLVYKPDEYGEYCQLYEEFIDSLNSVYSKNQNIDFYVYNIITDNVIKDRYKYDELFKSRLNDDIGYMSSSNIYSYEDYKKSFYKTDHHWNKDGQYDGYVDIMSMLDQNHVINKNNVIQFDNLRFSGSKARELGDTEIYDYFDVYDYIYPQMDIKINNEEVLDYGGSTMFLDGNINRDTDFENYYADYYGADYGLIHFCNKSNEGKDNILIISNSYSNPINKLIACSFYNTYVVDTRYYESQLGQEFNITSFIEKNNINKVIIIGNAMYFKNDKAKL